jgi:hypothetical protein
MKSEEIANKILQLAKIANDLYEAGAPNVAIRVNYLQVKRFADKIGIEVPEKDPVNPDKMIEKIKVMADKAITKAIPNLPW